MNNAAPPKCPGLMAAAKTSFAKMPLSIRNVNTDFAISADQRNGFTKFISLIILFCEIAAMGLSYAHSFWKAARIVAEIAPEAMLPSRGRNKRR